MWGVGMATLHVRRLDDAVVRRLKRRAVANHRSLEGEVRHILEQAAADDLAERMRTFRVLSERLRAETVDESQTSSHVLIREDRDRGHGPEW